MPRKDKPLSPDNLYDRYGRRRGPEKPWNRGPTPKLPDWIPPARLPANALPKRSYTGNIALAGEGSLVPEAYGRVMVRSPRIFAIGYVNDWYWLGALWCKGEINLIESIYNRNTYWLGSTGSVNHNQYVGNNTQNVDPKLALWVTGYADNMRGYAYTAIGFHHTLMVDVSSLSAIVQGKLIYDPRTTSTGYSSNFALMFRDVAISQGLSVDDDNIADAADFNDELLGGEKRRWGGLYFDKQDTVDKQLQVIAEHAGCFYIREAGVAKIIPDAPSTSVYIFSDASPISNIVEGSLKLAKKSIDNIPNQCTVEYLSNIKIPWRTSYAETPLPGGEIRTTTYRLPGFQSYAVAYRHAVERQNRFNLIDLSIEFETFDEALKVEEGDVITVTHNVGIVSKPFRATNVKASRFTGSWIIQAEEYDPAVYSDVVETEPTYPDFDLPYPYPVPQPNEPVLSCNSINDEMWIAIDWASLGGAYPFPHYYEVALYNIDADPVLVLLSTITDSDISIGPVMVGSTYQIIITTINFAAVRSIDRVVEFTCVIQVSGVQATSGVGTIDFSDPDIVWDTVPLESVVIRPAGPSYDYDNGVYFFSDTIYAGWTATEGAHYKWQSEPFSVPAIARTFTTGEFLLSYSVVSVISGSEVINVNYVSGVAGDWYDLFECNIAIETNPLNVLQHQIIDVTVATDNGAGGPVAGTGVTKRVTIISLNADTGWVQRDLFTGTNGTLLTDHTMDTEPASGWVNHANTMELLTGSAKASSAAESRCVFDAGISDAAFYTKISINASADAGVIFRAQDASNYWIFKATDTGTSNPVLSIIEVNAGTPTTRATHTLTGLGPCGWSEWQVVCNGNDILCRAELSLAYGGLPTLTYTSSSMATATLFGLFISGSTTTYVSDCMLEDTSPGLINMNPPT